LVDLLNQFGICNHWYSGILQFIISWQQDEEDESEEEEDENELIIQPMGGKRASSQPELDKGDIEQESPEDR
jgi:hypothetical protein